MKSGLFSMVMFVASLTTSTSSIASGAGMPLTTGTIEAVEIAADSAISESEGVRFGDPGADDRRFHEALLAWGCHGAGAIGLLLGATVGAIIFGGIGAYGTWVVNDHVDDTTRGTMVTASAFLSGALGVLVGGGLGAGVGLVFELFVPEKPVRRVIRVTRADPKGPATPATSLR